MKAWELPQFFHFFDFSNPVHQQVLSVLISTLLSSSSPSLHVCCNHNEFTKITIVSYPDDCSSLLTSCLGASVHFADHRKTDLEVYHWTTPFPDENHWCLFFVFGKLFKLLAWPAHMPSGQSDTWAHLQTHLTKFLHHLQPPSHISLHTGPWIHQSSFTSQSLPIHHSLCLQYCFFFCLLLGSFSTFELSLMISSERSSLVVLFFCPSTLFFIEFSTIHDHFTELCGLDF